METAEILIYVIKVLALQGLFLLFYRLVLSKLVHHSLNRGYLITTLLLAMVIPFIKSPLPESSSPVMPHVVEMVVYEWVAEPVQPAVSETSTQGWSFPIWQVLLGAYLAAVAFYLIRSGFYLIVLSRLKKQSEYVRKKWFKLFKISHSKPFSFFSSVFIPESLFGSEAFDPVLAHECAHVRKKHSFDRIFVDFLVALFWFNPFIYWYRKALIEVHEYQADAAVLQAFDDPAGYQEILYAQLQSPAYSGLVSHFNFSTIKKRIVMMNRSKTNANKYAYVFTLPVLALAVFAFTSKGEKSVNQLVEHLDAIAEPFESKTNALETVAEEVVQEDRFRPSILPVRTDADFKVTSMYGMRTNPVDDTKKMHLGIDLAAPVGTDVLATADGEVIEARNRTDGYGVVVTLQHGETYQTRYAQLSELKVAVGDEVERGQVIALTGNSGRSTGPHLHYEVYKDEEAVSPVGYIKNYRFKVRPTRSSSSEDRSHADGQVEEELIKLEKALYEAELARERAEEVRVRAEEEATEEELAEAEAAAELAEEAAAVAREQYVLAEEARSAREEDVRIEMETRAALAQEEALAFEQAKAQLAAADVELRKAAEQIYLEFKEKKAVLEGSDGNPLFIVDDEPMDFENHDLDSNDIQEIEVIKGDRAIELYGEDGRNGVIVVKTKNKKKSKDKNKNKNKNKNKDKDNR